jgi:protein-S-isoprenylcysteine O-methyltransferase Ste14
MSERQPGEKKRKGEWLEYLPIRRTKLRSYLMSLGVLIGLLDLNHIDLLPFAIGVVFIAGAAWVHVWSKGHLDKNASLTRSGPYRWVRDPFHFANFFIDLGLLLIVNNWIFTVVMMVFWVIAYSHRLGEEDEMLEELFGDDYRDYRAKIPRMIPYKPPMDKQYDKPFSVRHAPIYQGKAITRLFRFASYPYLLLGAAWLGDARLAVFDVGQHGLFWWAVFGYGFFHWLSEVAARLTTKRAPLLPLSLLRQPAPALGAGLWVALLWGLEQVPLAKGDFALEVTTSGLIAVGAGVVALVLAGIRVWTSARFRRLIEGAALTLASLFTPLPWLALVPACYFAAAFGYGDPWQSESDIDHVFPPAERLWPAPAWLALAAVYAAATAPLLV